MIPSEKLWFPLAQPAIIKFEGFSPEPYLCPAGKWTIGYGTTRYPNGEAVAKGDPRITEAQALFYLEASVNRVANQLFKLITVDITAHQAAALITLAYNIGVGAHDGVKGDLADSTLLADLARGHVQAAADQFLVWDKAHVNGHLVELPGLKTRRIFERTMFLTPD